MPLSYLYWPPPPPTARLQEWTTRMEIPDELPTRPNSSISQSQLWPDWLGRKGQVTARGCKWKLLSAKSHLYSGVPCDWILVQNCCCISPLGFLCSISFIPGVLKSQTHHFRKSPEAVWACRKVLPSATFQSQRVITRLWRQWMRIFLIVFHVLCNPFHWSLCHLPLLLLCNDGNAWGCS